MICSGAQKLGGDETDVYAMTLRETIKHFNDGVKLVQLEYVGKEGGGYDIVVMIYIKWKLYLQCVSIPSAAGTATMKA